MSILLHKPYLVKWSIKGEGVKNIKKKLSTLFMDAPYVDVDSSICIKAKGHKRALRRARPLL